MKWNVNLTTLILLIFFLTGCMNSNTIPLETEYYENKTQPQPNLIIFLRGMGGTINCPFKCHKCFETEGFVDTINQKHLPFDMVAPNAHFGYYQDRSFVIRLKKDIIDPAKKKGYQKIWLVGISMGAFGSVMYLKEHPEDIAGVIILGPFLGREDIINEVTVNGGLANWDPGPYDEKKDWARKLWHWLKEYDHYNIENAPIYLGIGSKDPYYKGQKLLADSLPPERVVEIDGKHRFTTFKNCWDIFLDLEVFNQ